MFQMKQFFRHAQKIIRKRMRKEGDNIITITQLYRYNVNTHIFSSPLCCIETRQSIYNIKYHNRAVIIFKLKGIHRVLFCSSVLLVQGFSWILLCVWYDVEDDSIAEDGRSLFCSVAIIIPALLLLIYLFPIMCFPGFPFLYKYINRTTDSKKREGGGQSVQNRLEWHIWKSLMVKCQM